MNFPNGLHSPGYDPRVINDWVKDDRVHRRVFVDPSVFQQEMEQIFNRGWVYVAHEAEIPNNGDFKRARIGLQPVIAVRGEDDEVRVLVNSCRHRGVALCQEDQGTARFFNCPYHGWVYNNLGELVDLPAPEQQNASFRKQDYALIQPPQVAIRAGFIFASFNSDVPNLDDYLGVAGKFLDFFVELSPTGRLVIDRGAHKYAYPGNWKVQVENSMDGYHPAVVHASFFADVLSARIGRDATSMVDETSPVLSRAFDNGHALADYRMVDRGAILGAKDAELPASQREYRSRLIERVGEERAKEILYYNGGNGYNLLVFPNLVLIGSQIRVIQPIAHDLTEVYASPTLLEDVAEEINLERLRGHEDFYGPASFGAPDDIEMFVRQWQGLQASSNEWLLYERGMEIEERDEEGLFAQCMTETSLRGIWRHYRRMMLAGLQEG